jgi:hypothetical protein
MTVNGKPVGRKTAEGFEVIRAIVEERPDYHLRDVARTVARVEGLNHAERVQALAMLFHYQQHHSTPTAQTYQTQNTANGQGGYNGTRT